MSLKKAALLIATTSLLSLNCQHPAASGPVSSEQVEEVIEVFTFKRIRMHLFEENEKKIVSNRLLLQEILAERGLAAPAFLKRMRSDSPALYKKLIGDS